MFTRARPLVFVALWLAVPTRATGQGAWVPHQEPCRLNTGHFLVKGGLLHLKIGVESRFADQRVGRLEEAKKVLHRAILESGQAQNPGAWYYLGRTYAEQQDITGADSAFRRARELAPDCAADIAGHSTRLAQLALNQARLKWDAGNQDSALAAFRIARNLDASNAEIAFLVSMLFASVQQPDSAARYLALGREVAGTQPAQATRERQAALDVARAYEARAYQQAPAAQTVARTRATRDSVARQVAADSSRLAQIVTEVAGIRAQGQRLSPRGLAAFQRDSTTLADRLTRDRPARDSLDTRATDDSTAAAGALAPAIQQFRDFTGRYPDDADAAATLLRLLSAAGDGAGLDTVVGVIAGSPSASGQSLVRAALTLDEEGLHAPAARLLEAALRRNPNDHGALAVVTRVYHLTGQATPLLEVARHRMALAPLDPNAAQAMAVASNLAGWQDSTMRYLALADTGLGWNVHVTAFTVGEHNASLNGYVVNVGSAARPATELVFEFLDTGGVVLGTATAPVPALDPRGRAQITVRLDQAGVVSWRYQRR